MAEETIYKLHVALAKIFYPKYSNKIDSGEFGIFKARVVKDIGEEEYWGNEIKLKGICPKIEYGSTYKVFCKLVDTNAKFGDTYEIVYISKVIDISNKERQKEFLRNVLSETVVERLFDSFDDVISLLEKKDVKSLMTVKGIKNKVALKLIQDYEDSKDYSTIYMELGQLGLTSNFIKKLVDFYKSPDIAVDMVRNNPYDLVRIDGIGFRKADEIAVKVGIEEFSPKRIKGYLYYFLKEEGEAGRSYVNYEVLMQSLYDNLGFVPEEIITSVASDMINKKEIIVTDNGKKIALKRFYELEKSIMKELNRLMIGRVDVMEDGEVVESRDYIPRPFIVNDMDGIIKRVEKEQGFEFTEEQMSAIRLSEKVNVMALTGLAGAGKSSTAKGICSLYDGYLITACALSGKASVRITEATGLPANTIHKTLQYDGEFNINEDNKLMTDVVVVDEATMINGSLFYALLKSIPSGAKVILMGDVQQLTPIGNCQVFADILDSGIIPTVRLTKPHRQALRSGIIPTSISVANQEPLFSNTYEGTSTLGELQDMDLVINSDREALLKLTLDAFQTELKRVDNIMEVQLCVAMRSKGALSCYNLNTLIQNLYNPELSQTRYLEVLFDKTKEEVRKYAIRIGDKVINTKNNYKCVDEDGNPCPIFNGNIGIVQDIDEDYNVIVDFEGIGEVVLTKEDAKNLELGYACTCHKLQGSGFTSVIVAVDNSSFIMNNCEWLYTAITRAKKHCTLVSQASAVNKCISTKEVKTKQTFLKDMLQENNDKKGECGMSSLYELTNDFLTLLDMMEDEDADMEMITDTLEGIEGEIEYKAEGYAKIIKSMEGTINAIKTEKSRLDDRMKSYENRIKWLKNNLEMTMKATGKTKFKTDLFSFNIQKNGGKRKLTVDVDIDKIPEEYRIKQPDIVNGDALREYLKTNGLEGIDGSVNCEWCHLEPQGESLRIK